jgi:hypothetical protein
MATVRDRLNSFRKRHNVTRSQLAEALSTPVRTMNGWIYEGHTPPGAMISLLDLIEDSPRARARLGLSRRKERPRGRPFERGHPFRFNDPRRPAAIAEARARKQADSGASKPKTKRKRNEQT